MFSEHVLTRNLIKQGDSVIQSLAECWYVQCTKLSFFIWLFLNYAFWFSVSFFLFFLGSRNFHEDRSPTEEWKHMANKVNHYIRHVCCYLLRPKDDIYITHRPFWNFPQIVCEYSMFLGIPRRFPKLFSFCTHQFWKHKITLNFHRRVRVSNLTLSQL